MWLAPYLKQKIMKVKILKQVGQTGLRTVGAIVDVNPKTAEHWIKFGWATKPTKPKPKPKKKDKK